MKKFLLAALLFSFQNIHAQNNDDLITIGKVDSIHSAILNETRPIMIYVPEEAESGQYGKQRFPVIYLLDGESHFYSVTGMIKQLSEMNGNTVCPRMIIVGIPNISFDSRTRDLTPTHVPAFSEDSTDTSPSGGGESFTAFLEKELIPHIDSIYPTAPYRMLIGHSFGGLTVMNTLINHTGLFNAYLAIDPSMWWDNRKLLNQLTGEFDKMNFSGKSFYLAIANTMRRGVDTLSVRKDTTALTRHIRANLDLAEYLKKSQNKTLRRNWKYYGNDDHTSLPLIAEYDAIRFIFDYYKLPSLFDLFDPAVDVDSTLRSHFKTVSQQMGYEILPPEPVINRLGFIFTRNGLMDKALKMYTMNIENYPESFSTYEGMGDYYSAISNYDKAKDYYNKALAIEDRKEIREKLEKLPK